MQVVSVSIVRYVDDAQPGWVECKLVDAWGREWAFVDKVPIFTSAFLNERSSYPQPGGIDCQVVKKWRDDHGREIITIDTETPYDVEATTGEVRFDILPEQLTEVRQSG